MRHKQGEEGTSVACLLTPYTFQAGGSYNIESEGIDWAKLLVSTWGRS